MASKNNSQQQENLNYLQKRQQNFKISVKELLVGLLQRLLVYKGPYDDGTIDEIRLLVKTTKGVLERTEKWESDLMDRFAKMERKIDIYEDKKGGETECYSRIGAENLEQASSKTEESSEPTWVELMRDLKKLIEKSIIKEAIVTTISAQEKEKFSKKNTTPGVGESSNSNNQGDDYSVELEEYTKHLDPQQKNCFNSLCVFPENAKLKKRLLIYWWIGLGFVQSAGNPNETAEKQGEVIFSDLMGKGILKEVHTRKHNQVIDQCSIDPEIHTQLISNCKREKLVRDKNGKIEGTWHFCCHDNSNVRAFLNLDQKYLRSEDIIEVLQNNAIQVLQFGRWHCNDPKFHIEVDNIDFLKKLEEEELTFLSLRGISRIDELPDESIGKLGNLKILDLRACHNLQKLPPKPKPKFLKFKSGKEKWFNNMTHLDVSECYLLDHIPKWICELSNLEVLKGFVASHGSKKNKYCRLGDLSILKKLRKLSIKIPKDMHPEDACGFEFLELSVLTVTWAQNENKTEIDNVQNIVFPKSLEKLDIRGYPEAEAEKLLNPEVLPNLKRLYIRGGKLTKISNHSSWKVEILRLRFSNDLEFDGHELKDIFTKLEYVEFEECLRLINFPKYRISWNMKDGSFSDAVGVPTAVELKIIKNRTAPSAKTNLKMMLALNGGDLVNRRHKLSLVLVLQYYKWGEETDKKIKTAIMFVIKKLSPFDRFSIVICSRSEFIVLRPLQEVKESSKWELENLVNSISHHSPVIPSDPGDGNNILNGLDMALDILKHQDCEDSCEDVAAIMLLSNFFNRDAPCCPIGNVAVHTFGIGTRYDLKALEAITNNSRGGSFSHVAEINNLTKALAVCLAGLLTVAVQDLTLTITPIREVGAVERVSAGEYVDYSKDNDVGPVIIKFGILYSGERRMVLVDLLLRAFDKEGRQGVLRVSYSYKLLGTSFKANPVIVDVCRMQTVPAHQPHTPPEVIAELTRLKAVEMIKESAVLDEGDKQSDKRLKQKVKEVTKIVSDLETKQADSEVSIKIFLMDELQLLQSTYSISLQRKKFLYSLFSSYARQRAAAKANNIEKSLSFATPYMWKLLEQADKFDTDPEMHLTTVEEDIDATFEADPRVPLTTGYEDVNEENEDVGEEDDEEISENVDDNDDEKKTMQMRKKITV